MQALLQCNACNAGLLLKLACFPVLNCLLNLQDAVGNYYDCRLTLQPAVVSGLCECCALHVACNVDRIIPSFVQVAYSATVT